MQATLAVVLPFFALVLCGFVAARSRLLPEAAIPGLNAYVLFFALPCLLFRFGSSMPFAALLDPALVGIYALCALLVIALTIALTWRRGHAAHGVELHGVDLRNAAFGALVAAFPNSGFMGVPLLVALFGQAAAGPVIGTLLVDLFLTSTVCLTLAQAHVHATARSDDDTVSSLVAIGARALRGALSNPQPWAIALGALAAAGHVTPPAPLAQFIRMLADSASPVALFAMGAVLWRAGQHAHTRTPPREVWPVALIKLIVHPALVGGLGLAARAAGVEVPSFGLTMLVLAAALPCASNVSLLAERFGADNGRVARIIMASTLLAFVSFTTLAWWLSSHL
jgi:predicted permease